MTSRTRYQTLDAIRARLTDPDLTTAAADLDHAAPLALAAFRRMQDARPGLPGAQAYDAPTVSGGSSTLTQPERLADQHDPTDQDRRTLDACLARLDRSTAGSLIVDRAEWLRQIHRDCLTVRRIVDAWTPHAPTDKQREAVEKANTEPVPLCQHCTPHRAKGHSEPVHRTGTASGNLDAPLGLCHWCYRFVLRCGRLPTRQEVQRNDNGQRVMVKA